MNCDQLADFVRYSGVKPKIQLVNRFTAGEFAPHSKRIKYESFAECCCRTLADVKMIIKYNKAWRHHTLEYLQTRSHIDDRDTVCSAVETAPYVAWWLGVLPAVKSGNWDVLDYVMDKLPFDSAQFEAVVIECDANERTKLVDAIARQLDDAQLQVAAQYAYETGQLDLVAACGAKTPIDGIINDMLDNEHPAYMTLLPCTRDYRLAVATAAKHGNWDAVNWLLAHKP